MQNSKTGYMPLPLPNGKTAQAALTLDLVRKIENAGGNIFKISDQLLHGELGLGDQMTLLRTIYHHAGFRQDENDDGTLERFLLRQAPARLLADVFAAILTPICDMGAVHRNDMGAVHQNDTGAVCQNDRVAVQMGERQSRRICAR